MTNKISVVAPELPLKLGDVVSLNINEKGQLVASNQSQANSLACHATVIAFQSEWIADGPWIYALPI